MGEAREVHEHELKVNINDPTSFAHAEWAHQGNYVKYYLIVVSNSLGSIAKKVLMTLWTHIYTYVYINVYIHYIGMHRINIYRSYIYIYIKHICTYVYICVIYYIIYVHSTYIGAYIHMYV